MDELAVEEEASKLVIEELEAEEKQSFLAKSE